MSIKPESVNSVVPEDDQKDKREVEKVAMKVLENKRKACFAAVVMWSGLTHSARRRIEKKGTVISFAVVVASRPEAEWGAQD